MIKFLPARGRKTTKLDEISPGRNYDWELNLKNKTINLNRIPPGRGVRKKKGIEFPPAGIMIGNWI